MKLAEFLKKNKESNSEAYIISEIGNNHGGSIKNAMRMVEESEKCGVSAVKFQKRNNKELFTPEFYDTPYDNPHSFGETYGSHRDNLELDINQMSELKIYTEKLNLDFIVTPFDFTSLEELESINCPIYKIASADLINIPLIREVAKTKKPIILSTGASEIDDIERAMKELEFHPFPPVLLHCTAAYPCPIENMNLSCIPILKETFPSCIVGLSDHENGIDAGPLAYMLGARVFEKHFTLDHGWKGTDNCFSLMPEGMRRFVRNLNRVPLLLGVPTKELQNVETKPIYKMRKSVMYKEDLPAGHVLKSSDLVLKCPGSGLPAYHIYEAAGKKLTCSVSRYQNYAFEHVI